MERTAVVSCLLLLLVLTAGCSERAEPDSAPAAVAESLPEKTASPEYHDPAAVHAAALQGNVELVQRALASGFDVNQTNADQQTLLMLASFNGHSGLCRLLIASGASVNAYDYKYSTPLMFAASGPFPETVQLLLESGADPNAVDHDEGFTALMHAAAEGQLEVVRVLMEHGADPSIRDVDGDTAESFARQNGHLQTAEYLRNHRGGAGGD